MNQSNTIIKLSESLCKAQKKFKTAIKNKNNPYFKSKYADYTEVLSCVKEPLNSEGITILQPIVKGAEGKDYIETILLHESGEYISSLTEIHSIPTYVKDKDNYQILAMYIKPQDYGSAITYTRRYALSSMLSLDSDEDDDGNIANGNQPTQPVKQIDPTRERIIKLNGIVSKLLTSKKTTPEELEKYLEFPVVDIPKHLAQAEIKIKKLIEGFRK